MTASLWRLTLLFLLTIQYVPASTYAQTYPPMDSVRLQVNSDGDTLVAIRRLFLAKRGSAKIAIWTGVGLGVTCGLIGLGSYALVNSAKKSTSGKPLEESPASISLKFSLPGLAISGIGLVRRIRFNRQREAVVIAAYEQGRGLPPFILRKFRRQHFASQ
ncbi:hypothetical protein GCM10027592_32430 [Spirosoma flavus]